LPRLRDLPSDQWIHISCCTAQGRYRLSAGDKDLFNQRAAGSLTIAAERSEAEVSTVTDMSNHMHLMVRGRSARWFIL